MLLYFFSKASSKELLPFKKTSLNLPSHSPIKMALHIKDDLSRIIETDIASNRIKSFVWISIAAINPHFSSLNPDSIDYRKLMADHLKNDQNTAYKVRTAIKNCFTPDQDLKWIVNSRRQALWIEQYIASAITQVRPSSSNHIPTTFKPSLSEIWGFSIPFHLLEKNRSTALFDYWTSTNFFLRMQDRIEQSKSMQLAWQNFVKADKIFAWLDADDAEKKRASFWAWLEVRDKTITQSQPQFHSHEELLIFFDNPRFVESDKEVFSKNYRKIWNQQQYREESNGKKQCNFVLSEKTISSLKMLAQKHGLTRTEIIELIIDSEAKDEIYISERLRRKSALKTPM